MKDQADPWFGKGNGGGGGWGRGIRARISFYVLKHYVFACMHAQANKGGGAPDQQRPPIPLDPHQNTMQKPSYLHRPISMSNHLPVSICVETGEIGVFNIWWISHKRAWEVKGLVGAHDLDLHHPPPRWRRWKLWAYPRHKLFLRMHNHYDAVILFAC